MATVVIQRCPDCPQIAARTQEAAAVLGADLGMIAQVRDGEKSEFTVLVDGVPVIQRTSDSLPSVDEVEAAVRNAVPPRG